ncbi:Uu.00g039350.m01.CDS01 [Anthostomella pinea]|uniref:Uu.00g039350.m01.CDS01 n=1 Tax=Anthostomella pinea TaxID=933095 RepID=A0AAI8VAH3_9PEZI|nr:Uu.00g039350.m01.CDS01 [Anthostomella pinea]
MNSLEAIFGELGISQYLGTFVDQGFDSWDTILDITESDLDALGVKLGHRRKLQRRIANYRGLAPDASLAASPTRASIEETRLDSNRSEPARTDHKDGSTATKRKYRRHPKVRKYFDDYTREREANAWSKADENGPERPPSAYVLFSNKMREDLKGQNLTFTEIAKLVGENWQNLNRAEKEPFERQAHQAKDRYNRDLAEYKKTPEFRKYSEYLNEFRKRQALQLHEKDTSKRLKTESDGTRPGSLRGGSMGPGGTNSRAGSGAESVTGSEPPPTQQQRMGAVLPGAESYFPLTSGPSYQDETFHSSRTLSMEDANGSRPAKGA